ncbi:MAG TPA: hypothetical protein VGH16_06550 [Candidatus Binatia bacterium]
MISRVHRRWLLILVAALSLPVLGRADSFPGGFIEKADTKVVRPRLTASQIASFVPSNRGKFRFPPPYNTEAIRITTAADCGGKDCVAHVGYSYWMNINNHVGSDTMLIFLGLDRRYGGTGPTLFSYNKLTDEVKNLGPLFDGGSRLSWRGGLDWYFSARQPTKLYVNDEDARLYRYDVRTKSLETVFDAAPRFGRDKDITQPHSSNDDRVHSATLRCKRSGCTDGTHTAVGDEDMLGCLVYNEGKHEFSNYPRKQKFDECQIDASGRWLIILEKVQAAEPDSIDNVIIDLETGKQRTILSNQNKVSGAAHGAISHLDLGYGYMIGADNSYRLGNAKVLYKFAEDPLQGKLVYYNGDWNAPAPNHISNRNSGSDVPPEQQYACGSGASKNNGPRANEIVCFTLNGSLDVLVVAPVMTDLNVSSRCDDYCLQPKGNLDVTGRYFIWTTNTGGQRLDAFMVKVPGQLLSSHRASR